MKGKLSIKIFLTTLVVSLVSIVVSCQKEKVLPADMLSGTTVNTLYVKGYSLNKPIYVKVGSQNIEVAKCEAKQSLDISSEQNAIKIPFAPGENQVDVKFCNAAGTVLKTYVFSNTSTGVLKFLSADSLYLNPVISQPTAGKMGIMLQYASAELPNFEEEVDIALYYVSKTGVPTSTLYKKITNVSKYSFSTMVELDRPLATSYASMFALVVLRAGTNNALPLANFSANSSKYVFSFSPNTTRIYSITDSFSDMQYGVTQIENYVR
jgi:hypothetical protein